MTFKGKISQNQRDIILFYLELSSFHHTLSVMSLWVGQETEESHVY